MNVAVAFDSNIMSGRLLPIEAGSVMNNKGNKSKEYTGDWLIMSNRIFYDTDLAPYHVLELGKSNVDLDSDHKFKNQVD